MKKYREFVIENKRNIRELFIELDQVKNYVN